MRVVLSLPMMQSMFIVLATKHGVFRSQSGTHNKLRNLPETDWFIDAIDCAGIGGEFAKYKTSVQDATTKHVRFKKQSEPLELEALMKIEPGFTASDREQWSRESWFLARFQDYELI